MESVLVVRPSSLGDIVYALAIATDIRRAHPGVAVDWVSEPGFAPLVALCPDVARVVTSGLRRWRRAPLSRTTWRDVGENVTAQRTRWIRIVLASIGEVVSATVTHTDTAMGAPLSRSRERSDQAQKPQSGHRADVDVVTK